MATYEHKTFCGNYTFALRKRTKNGAYQYDFYVAGTRYRGTTKHKDLVAAKYLTQNLIDLELKKSRGLAGRLKLGEAIQQYYDNKWPRSSRKNNQDFQDKRYRIDKFKEFIGEDVAIDLWTRQEATASIQRFIDDRRRPKENKETGEYKVLSDRSSVNDQLAVSNLFGYLLKRALVPWESNPASRHLLDVAKPVNIPEAPADELELQKLLTLTKKTKHILYPVLVLMCNGLRPIGACRVAWEDIVFGERPYIQIKEKRDLRQIPLNEWAFKELAWWRKMHPEDINVWPHHKRTAEKQLADIRASNKKDFSETLTLQGIRRRNTYQLYRSGIDVREGAKVMGHSVQTQMRHYFDAQRLDATEAANALAPIQPKRAKKKVRRK